MNKFNNVNRGENKGKLLSHDFVVTEFIQFNYQRNQNIKLPFEINPKDSAIAIWITQGNRLESLQAVAGYL